MSQLRTIILHLCVLGASLAFSGCIAALLGGGAVAAGTVVYLSGALKTTQSVSLDEAMEASRSAVRSLDLALKQETKDGITGHIVAEGADDTTYTIDLESKDTELTQISIRVGYFGDETRSKLVLSRIQENFKTEQRDAPRPVSSH